MKNYPIQMPAVFYCPEKWQHTKCPENYQGWHAWAEKKYRLGYTQTMCPRCGYFAIWTKLKATSIKK